MDYYLYGSAALLRTFARVSSTKVRQKLVPPPGGLQRQPPYFFYRISWLPIQKTCFPLWDELKLCTAIRNARRPWKSSLRFNPPFKSFKLYTLELSLTLALWLLNLFANKSLKRIILIFIFSKNLFYYKLYFYILFIYLIYLYINIYFLNSCSCPYFAE